jgi:hypothetical protein
VGSVTVTDMAAVMSCPPLWTRTPEENSATYHLRVTAGAAGFTRRVKTTWVEEASCPVTFRCPGSLPVKEALKVRKDLVVSTERIVAVTAEAPAGSVTVPVWKLWGWAAKDMPAKPKRVTPKRRSNGFLSRLFTARRPRSVLIGVVFPSNVEGRELYPEGPGRAGDAKGSGAFGRRQRGPLQDVVRGLSVVLLGVSCRRLSIGPIRQIRPMPRLSRYFPALLPSRSGWSPVPPRRTKRTHKRRCIGPASRA